MLDEAKKNMQGQPQQSGEEEKQNDNAKKAGDGVNGAGDSSATQSSHGKSNKYTEDRALEKKSAIDASKLPEEYRKLIDSYNKTQ